MRTASDDQATEVTLPDDINRVVSLVPSLTEAIAVSAPGMLVGATDWCSHPADLEVVRVRGTKNPDLARIRELRPELVICNKEENRKRDVERLRQAGVAVWVTVIETLDESLASLHRLLEQALGLPEPAWLRRAAEVWAQPAPDRDRVPVIVPIWRDPWIVVGSATFTGSVLDRLGAANLFGEHPERYPHVDLDALRDAAARADAVVILPDEPYRFGPDDGPESFADRRVALVSGRSLTWYGPSLATARAELESQLWRDAPSR